MQKVVIIGISGVGKSWFARDISRKTNIPIIHYDALCWDRDWTEVHEAEVGKRILDAIQSDAWILEGYINPAAQARLTASDTVLYLDYPGWRAAWGGFQRWLRHRKSSRPELPEGCEDRWSWKRLRIMWTRDERKEIEKEIQGFEQKILRFKSPNQVKKYLKEFSK